MFSKGQNTIAYDNKLKLIQTKMKFLNDSATFIRQDRDLSNIIQ